MTHFRGKDCVAIEVQYHKHDEEMVTETSVCAQDVTLQEFYDVVMVLRNAIKGAKKLDSSWPPTSADSSEGQMLKMAPVQMF